MNTLLGVRVLLVEDQALIAAMVEDMVLELGATVVGPAGTVAKGIALARSTEIDAAVLDVNVGGERVDALAELLRAKSVPMIFATGYGQGAADVAQGAPIIDKPYTPEKLAMALLSTLRVERD